MKNLTLTATLTLSLASSALSALAMDHFSGATPERPAAARGARPGEDLTTIEQREQQKRGLLQFLCDIEQSRLPEQTEQQRIQLLDIRREMSVGLFKDIGIITKEFLDALRVMSLGEATQQQRIQLLNMLSEIVNGLPKQTRQEKKKLLQFLYDIQESCLPAQTQQQRIYLLDIRRKMAEGLPKDIKERTKEFLYAVRVIAATAGD